MRDPTTRTRLLDSAQALVQRVGANAMSYNDLSREVGISKPSIHHHFPTKSELLVALIDRYSEYFLGLLRGIGASKARGAAKVARYARLFEATLTRGSQDGACPCGMLGAEVSTLAPEVAAKLQAFYRANARGLAAMLEEGRADGSLSFSGRAEDLAWLLFSMLEGAMLVARVEGGVAQLARIFRQFQRLVSA
jgi:TetR/AcrR family transcriptional repressor of nem operon